MQILLILLGPLFANWLVRRIRVDQWLSPVVLAYAIGILFANWKVFSLSQEISTTFSEGTILLAIPLLLYSTDLRAWVKYAPQTILSFALCILSGLTASFLVGFFFQGDVIDNSLVSGMLTTFPQCNS